MIILGIDTSLRSSGYGVLSVEGSRMRALEAGRIRNDPKLPLSACLRAIHARVAELIAAYAPDVISIESVIYGKNSSWARRAAPWSWRRRRAACRCTSTSRAA